MAKKIYGKLIATYQKNSDGSKVGLMNRTLEIYELKKVYLDNIDYIIH